MERSIKGTETEKNLLRHLPENHKLRTVIAFFSKIAKEDGYEQIAGIFYETALQEEMHA